MGRRRSGPRFRWGRGRNPRIIDEDNLQAIAEITGGQYYKAESADQLQEALGDLPSQVAVVKKHVDIASWFAGAGGLLSRSPSGSRCGGTGYARRVWCPETSTIPQAHLSDRRHVGRDASRCVGLLLTLRCD